MNLNTLSIFLVFISIGMSDSAGPIASLAQGTFKISTTIASLLTMLAYILYGIFLIPIRLLQGKIGDKFVLSFGLSIAFLGPVITILKELSGSMDADGTSIQTAFLVPVLCIVYLLFIAINNNRKIQYEKG